MDLLVALGYFLADVVIRQQVFAVEGAYLFVVWAYLMFAMRFDTDQMRFQI